MSHKDNIGEVLIKLDNVKMDIDEATEEVRSALYEIDYWRKEAQAATIKLEEAKVEMDTYLEELWIDQ